MGKTWLCAAALLAACQSSDVEEMEPPPAGEWASLLVNGGFDESTGAGPSRVVPGWEFFALGNVPYEGPLGDFVRTSPELEPTGTAAGGHALQIPVGAPFLGVAQTVRLPEGTRRLRVRWAERSAVTETFFTGIVVLMNDGVAAVYDRGPADESGWRAVEQLPIEVPEGTAEARLVIVDYLPSGTFAIDSLVLEAAR